MTPNQAASLMGRRSARARIQKWGEKEFVRKMQEWGKLARSPSKEIAQGEVMI